MQRFTLAANNANITKKDVKRVEFSMKRAIKFRDDAIIASLLVALKQVIEQNNTDVLDMLENAATQCKHEVGMREVRELVNFSNADSVVDKLAFALCKRINYLDYEVQDAIAGRPGRDVQKAYNAKRVSC